MTGSTVILIIVGRLSISERIKFLSIIQSWHLKNKTKMLFQLSWVIFSYGFWAFGGMLASTGIVKKILWSGILEASSMFVTRETSPHWLSSGFLYIRPIMILIVTIFMFAATSHANNVLLRLLERHERGTQVFILTTCASLYGLSCWLMAGTFSLSNSSTITWIAFVLLILMLIAHVIAISGLGTLFDVSTGLFLVSWSLRLAIKDSTVSDDTSGWLSLAILSLISVVISFSALMAVPFVVMDEAAYSLDWWTILTNWSLRWFSIVPGLIYLYELYGTIQANSYNDYGFWRIIQAIVLVLLVYIRFFFRLSENRSSSRS